MRSWLSSLGARGGLLLTAPWQRAPLLLVRRPSVALAVAGAALILGVTGAATSLYVSSAANAALHRQLAGACPWHIGPRAEAVQELHPSYSAEAGAPFGRRDALVRQAAADVPQLRAPKVTFIAGGVPITADGAGGLHTLVSRPGFREHIEVVAAGRGPGIWLHAESAQRMGARPGDTVRVAGQLRRPGGALEPVTLPVAGTFRELAPRKNSNFWCPMSEAIELPPFDQRPNHPLAFVDRGTFLQIGHSAGLRFDETWAFPVRTEGLTTTRAQRTSAGIEAMAAQLGSRSENFGGLHVDALLPKKTERAQLVGSSVSSAIGPVSVAGVLVALLLVGAAGNYWVDRRRAEVDLLVSRGIGPVALAGKALLETLLPLSAGTAAGWAVALFLVTRLGPSPLLSAGAPAAALAVTGGCFVAALLALGGTAAVRIRSGSARPMGVGAARPRRRRPGMAVCRRHECGHRGHPGGDGGAGRPATPDIPAALPRRCGIAGCTAGPPRGPRPGRRRVALVDAVLPRRPQSFGRTRRHAPATGGDAVPVGVLVYAAALSGSVRTTLDAKVHLFSGSDLAVRVERGTTVPAGLRNEVTRVVRLADQSLNAAPADVLAVDPRRFPRQAHWQAAYADERLDTLMARIRHAGDGPVPVLAADADVPEGPATLTVDGPGEPVDVAVTVVGTPTNFPGQRGPPVVVMDQRALASVADAGFPELWARGDGERVLSLLDRAGVRVLHVNTTEEVLDAANFLAVAYTFRFLTALALLIGVVGLAGLLLYLEARSRARRVFYVLARRMGLTRRGHLGSLLVELSGLFAAGLAVGGGLAWIAVLTVYRRLDVEPALPPGPLLPVPLGIFALVALCAGVIVVLASLLAQRSVDRAQPAEVLRAGE